MRQLEGRLLCEEVLLRLTPGSLSYFREHISVGGSAGL